MEEGCREALAQRYVMMCKEMLVVEAQSGKERERCASN